MLGYAGIRTHKIKTMKDLRLIYRGHEDITYANW